MFTKRQINKAWKALLNNEQTFDSNLSTNKALEYWRFLHIEPPNCVVEECEKIYQKYGGIYLGSRIKRKNTIVKRLSRKGKHYKLGEMQDIAGARIVFET